MAVAVFGGAPGGFADAPFLASALLSRQPVPVRQSGSDGLASHGSVPAQTLDAFGLLNGWRWMKSATLLGFGVSRVVAFCRSLGRCVSLEVAQVLMRLDLID